MNKSTLVIGAEVYVTDDMSEQDGHIQVTWTEPKICMTQIHKAKDGDQYEHWVIIHSEDQARSMVMALKGMAAINGWDI